MRIGLAVMAAVLLLCGVRHLDAKECPALVAKVCAVDQARQLMTFNNSCEATRAGATVLHSKECNGTFCPRNCVVGHGVYARGVFTGKIMPYDNMCWAEKNFAVFVKYGACPGPSAM